MTLSIDHFSERRCKVGFVLSVGILILLVAGMIGAFSLAFDHLFDIYLFHLNAAPLFGVIFACMVMLMERDPVAYICVYTSARLLGARERKDWDGLEAP